MGLFCDNIIEIQFFDRLKGAVKKQIGVCRDVYK